MHVEFGTLQRRAFVFGRDSYLLDEEIIDVVPLMSGEDVASGSGIELAFLVGSLHAPDLVVFRFGPEEQHWVRGTQWLLRSSTDIFALHSRLERGLLEMLSAAYHMVDRARTQSFKGGGHMSHLVTAINAPSSYSSIARARGGALADAVPPTLRAWLRRKSSKRVSADSDDTNEVRSMRRSILSFRARAASVARGTDNYVASSSRRGTNGHDSIAEPSTESDLGAALATTSGHPRGERVDFWEYVAHVLELIATAPANALVANLAVEVSSQVQAADGQLSSGRSSGNALANVTRGAAEITRGAAELFTGGAADITRGAADITRGAANVTWGAAECATRGAAGIAGAVAKSVFAGDALKASGFNCNGQRSTAQHHKITLRQLEAFWLKAQDEVPRAAVPPWAVLSATPHVLPSLVARAREPRR